MTRNPEFGNVTGTKDKDYDIIWFTEACLSNVLRLETYIEDAALSGDDELADFFRKAQHERLPGLPAAGRRVHGAPPERSGRVIPTSCRPHAGRSLDGRH